MKAFPSTLPVPESVLAIARTLDGAGHEVWCVGGAVRDRLLGESGGDFDLATSATPQQVMHLFRRTVPVGVAHGTVAVLDRDNIPHEITTFRADVRTDGRHAEVEFGVSLEEDLARRDFTINAIAYHPVTHDWRDPFDGALDLERRLLRAVGDPRLRFREDFLRVLRALRFIARFDLTVDNATWSAMQEARDGLAGLSAERVRDEWFKGIRSAQSVQTLCKLWHDAGGLERWLPEVAVTRCGTDALAALPPDPVLVTAWLSRDPAATLARLRCSNAEIDRGRRIGGSRNAWPDVGRPEDVRRWLARCGPVADDLIRIAEAEEHPAGLAAAADAERKAGVPLAVADLAVTGSDLLAAGVPEGPRIGQTLRALLDHVLAHPDANERDALLAYAANLPESPAHRPPRTRGDAGRSGP